MKTQAFIKVITATGVVLFGCGLFPAPGASYLVGLSPYYDVADRENILKQLLLFTLQGVSPRDDITVFDAWNRQVVTRLVIPNGKLFENNAQARTRRLGAGIIAVKNFILAERAHSLEMTGAIRLPEFLDLAGSQLRVPGQTLRVIIIASPFYTGEDKAFDMREAFPSDANLIADERSSPFGTALRKNRLAGVTVYYAYLHDCFVNSYHQERITRFWTLYVKQTGGCLTTFAPSVELAFQRARDNIQQPVVQAEIDTDDTKLEMRHVRPRSIPAWFGPTNFIQDAILLNPALQSTQAGTTANPVAPIVITHVASVTNVTAETTPPEFPVPAKSNILGIGIMWGAPVDCDLYVRPFPGAEELYYRHTKSKEGRYFHDYRRANEGIDYEYVELKTPIDIRNVSCWANYYAGNSWPVNGTVIVYYEGKTFYGEFSLASRTGNHGAESDSRNTSPHWAKIDLLKIVGLSKSSSIANGGR